MAKTIERREGKKFSENKELDVKVVDAKVVEAIRCGKTQTNEIKAWLTKELLLSGSNLDRSLDRSLQRLRRRKLIVYDFRLGWRPLPW